MKPREGDTYFFTQGIQNIDGEATEPWSVDLGEIPADTYHIVITGILIAQTVPYAAYVQLDPIHPTTGDPINWDGDFMANPRADANHPGGLRVHFSDQYVVDLSEPAVLRLSVAADADMTLYQARVVATIVNRQN